jgi:hypothetical protein
MIDLLTASMIEVDKRHLTVDFAPAIEKALVKLEKMNILGKQACVAGFHIGVKQVEDNTWRTNTCMKMHQAPHDQTQNTSPEDLCFTAADGPTRWGKEWLISSWEILPPMNLVHTYQAIQTAQQSVKGSGRKRTTKASKEAP